MSKNKKEESRLAKCPYYKCENRCVIFCEGVQAGHCIHMAFSTCTGKLEYEKKFCRTRWGDCMIAAGQNQRWGYSEFGGSCGAN